MSNQIHKIKAIVIIVTRNRAQSLDRCLTSLSKQTFLPTQVIVVDNASTDRTKQILDKFKKRLSLKYLYESRISMAAARNTGLRHANGDIVLILDDDCIANKYWVQRTINSHTKHPEASAIQGRLISRPKESIYSLILQRQRAVRIKMSRLRSGGIIYLDTANCSLKKKHIISQNLSFYETKRYTGPDSNLAAQIISKGGCIIFDEKIIVYHQERSSLGEFLKQRYRNGVIPVIMKKRWPKLKFYFYHSGILKYIYIYLSINRHLIKQKRYLDCISLPFILFLSIIVFEFSGLVERFRDEQYLML